MRSGCGSKIGVLNGTLVNGKVEKNLRNPSCLIASHTRGFCSASQVTCNTLLKLFALTKDGQRAYELLQAGVHAVTLRQVEVLGWQWIGEDSRGAV